MHRLCGNVAAGSRNQTRHLLRSSSPGVALECCTCLTGERLEMVSGIAGAERHCTVHSTELRIRGYFQRYALYKSTFYLLTYLLRVISAEQRSPTHCNAWAQPTGEVSREYRLR